jgi:selenide,water dikinase
VADPAHLRQAIENMLTLNRKPARLMQQVGVHAATDITGFGFLGHSFELAEKSGVGLRFFVDKLPFLDGALEYADGWLFPGGACNNQSFYAPSVRFAPDISEEMQMLLFTPETSGGLLIALPPEKWERLRALFEVENQPYWMVGEVVEGEGIEILN